MEHRSRQHDLQWLVGVLATEIRNGGMRAPEEPAQPKDFALPLLQKKEKTRHNRKKVTEQYRSYFARKAHHAGVIRIKGGPG